VADHLASWRRVAASPARYDGIETRLEDLAGRPPVFTLGAVSLLVVTWVLLGRHGSAGNLLLQLQPDALSHLVRRVVDTRGVRTTLERTCRCQTGASPGDGTRKGPDGPVSILCSRSGSGRGSAGGRRHRALEQGDVGDQADLDA
jgi:hypothetical protein